MADFFTDTSQYDLARKRAAAQSNVDLQTRQDALNRRFASLGNLDSGAQLKQQEIAANDVNSQLADTNAGIDAAQTADLANRAGIKQGQEFQTSERLGTQNFQTGLQNSAQSFANAQRLGSQDYGTSERLGTQDFANTQRLGTQDFATSERLGNQDFLNMQRLGTQDFATSERLGTQNFEGIQATLARGQQDNQFMTSTELAKQQFTEAKNQFAQTFGEDQLTNQRNYELAQQSLNKQGVLENTLGSYFDPVTGINFKAVSNTLKKSFHF